MQLLEREAQLRYLDDVLREVRQEGGRTALIYGEAGIGKTSLVEHFLQAQAESWRVLRGACDSLFTPRPLGPFHDIALQTGGELLQELHAGADRNTIFHASLRELGSRPTIVVVEDVHWADEATLDVLKFLGRRIRQTHMLLILTYRDDELGANHPLRHLLGDLGASGSLHRIPVPPLSSDAVGSLAGNRKVDPEALHRLTNGNPFFVTEVLATESGISETVRDAVLARAAGLSRSARNTLEAAAIIGLRVEPWLLQQLADPDSSTIEECIAAGMLQAHGDAYAFRHELARQTILESIAPHRSLALHRAALGALQTRAVTRQDLARLADHAAATQDAELVLHYAPLAARQASAASSHREAATHFELALRFADQLPAAQHAQMLDEYVGEVAFSGAFQKCVAPAETAASLWKAAGDSLRQGDTLANLGIILFPLGRKAEAEQAARTAISILEALPEGPELARAYKSACFLCMETRDLTEAVYWGEKAISLAERCGDMDTLARACNYAGCSVMLSDYSRGRALLERSLEIGLRSNLHFAVGGAFSNHAQMLVEMFRMSEAHPLLERGIAYTRDHDDDYHLNTLLTVQAVALFHEGHWEQARLALLHALGRPGADFAIRANGALTLALLGVRQGVPTAPSDLEEAVKAFGQLELIFPLRAIHAGPAELAWLTGDPAGTIRHARTVYDAADSRRLAWITGELAFWRWRAGDDFVPPAWIAPPYLAQIAGDWRGAADQWAQLGCPYQQGMALMDGDEDAQLQALKIFEELGARPIAEKLKQQMRAQGVRSIPRGPRPATRDSAFGLTARELDVLAALVTGAANSAIAKQLSLSTRTVEHHVASILQKTGTESRSEAIALALREHLIPAG